MAVTVYHYRDCSTCKRALAWLREQGVTYRTIDLTEETPSARTLGELHRRSGLPVRKLFNTSGNSYRNGGFKERLPALNDPQALAALAADGMLIKRPLLVTEDQVCVGFKEAEWQAAVRGCP